MSYVVALNFSSKIYLVAMVLVINIHINKKESRFMTMEFAQIESTHFESNTITKVEIH